MLLSISYIPQWKYNKKVLEFEFLSLKQKRWQFGTSNFSVFGAELQVLDGTFTGSFGPKLESPKERRAARGGLLKTMDL